MSAIETDPMETLLLTQGKTIEVLIDTLKDLTRLIEAIDEQSREDAARLTQMIEEVRGEIENVRA